MAASLSGGTHDRPAVGTDWLAEVDETMFLLSFKGKLSGLDRTARKRGGKATQRVLTHEQVPVLVASNRAGTTIDCVLKAKDLATLSVALKPFLTKDVVLCTDGSKAFADAARIGHREHAVNLPVGVRVDGAWHVKNVNAYHIRLKKLGTKVSRGGHVLLGQLSRLVSCPRP